MNRVKTLGAFISLLILTGCEAPTVGYQSKVTEQIIQVSYSKPQMEQNCTLIKSQIIKDYVQPFAIVDSDLIKKYFDDEKLKYANDLGANYIYFQLLKALDNTLQPMSMSINYMGCDHLISEEEKDSI